VVELILDLAGFTADRDLASLIAVEPACGSGAFLVPIAERLVASCRIHGRPLEDARWALRAFDLLPSNVDLAKSAVSSVLRLQRRIRHWYARSLTSGYSALTSY
jgi:type I restriction-modification system DNA methylase subunit